MSAPVNYAVFARNCTSVGALTIVVWEGIANWDLEYKYLTKESRSPPTNIKWLFLYSRYFGIGAQIINCILTGGILSQLPVKTEHCRVWYSFQVIVGRSLLAALEVVLGLRVYVLHGRSFRIALFLAGMIFLGITVSLVYGIGSILEMNYDSDCHARGSPNGPFCVSLSILITHVLLWSLTVQKRNIGAHTGWRKHHVIHAVVHDGAWIMFLMFCTQLTLGQRGLQTHDFQVISASIVPYILLDHLVALNIVFSWPMALISIFCCRLILKMHTIRSPESSPDLEFTTCS
ncbi:hypothetical protein BDZ94DRAFT_1297996 [Collybia nuda]|uniref:DUF6533 domain-containing protein n=1 Tax=Collybia nuda TaxID=64659 RepID=A0A9P6CJX0_9AGAR|nr:hypothetical protein BDZ94DRAFT_1297996 [Collybia nuda]